MAVIFAGALCRYQKGSATPGAYFGIAGLAEAPIIFGSLVLRAVPEQVVTLTTGQLTYRTIDPLRDAELLVRHQIDACVATYGNDSRYQGTAQYLRWLEAKVDEFPEGFLLAFREDRCVGQLELEVPYGLRTGYVNLFYVTPQFRGIGFGRLLHQRAEFYFRSWEASSVRLHVSPTNRPAVKFYERMGYRRTFNAADRRLWEMEKQL